MLPFMNQMMSLAGKKVWTLRFNAEGRVVQRLEYNGKPHKLEPNEMVCTEDQYKTYLEWVVHSGTLVYRPLESPNVAITGVTSWALGQRRAYRPVSDDQLRIMRKLALGLGAHIECCNQGEWCSEWHTREQLREVLSDIDAHLETHKT